MPSKTSLIPISIFLTLIFTILLVTAQFTEWKYQCARSIYQVRLFAARSKMPTKTPLIPISIILILLFIPILATAQTSDNGLVAEWHFDEGKGNIVKDTSGNGNDGIIHGATWVDGKFGKALSFDGNGDYVEITPQSDVSAIGDFTISAWTYLKDWKSQTASNKDRQYIFDGHSHSKTVTNDFFRPGFSLVYDGNSYTEEIHNGIYYGDSRYVELNTQISLKGKWIHNVFMRKGKRDYTYINGQLISANYDKNVKRDDLLNMQHNWFIGTFSGNNPNYNRGVFNYGFYGIIDEVRIYNRALTPEEIKALYEGVRTALTITKSLSTSTLQEGTQSTVTLNIKNTGSTPISNIKITDSLPFAFKLISGTLTKSIPSLTAEQSTTLQYTFEPVGIGTINLPEATATYQDQNGKSYTAKSKSLAITISAKDSDSDGLSDGQEL